MNIPLYMPVVSLSSNRLCNPAIWELDLFLDYTESYLHCEQSRANDRFLFGKQLLLYSDHILQTMAIGIALGIVSLFAVIMTGVTTALCCKLKSQGSGQK